MHLDPPTHYRQIAVKRDKVNMDLTPKIPIFSFKNFSTSQALISLKFSEYPTDN